MKKNRLMALLFTGAMLLSMTACGKDPSELVYLKDFKPDKYVTLGDYTGLPTTIAAPEVTEDDIDTAIMNSGLSDDCKVPVGDRDVVEVGDLANIDFVGTMDGEEFEGSKKMAVTILSLTTGEELDRWLLDYCQLIRLLIQKKRVDNNVILVENAKKIVQENFSDPDLSVESVCDALHVSTSHFSKIFKQETGGTFMNYMISLRMEHAKKLLLQTNYKSLVIGEMVGYPEPNYFSYVFKKNCGISPAKYRKQNDEK